MKRIYHPYWNWEEYKAGMWRNVSALKAVSFLSAAVKFTGDAELYGSFMVRVANEWPISCEHNLTDISQNRRAWIGHAAACLAIGVPEHITRAAWGRLTQNQQDEANAKADEAIRYWELNHA